jgi:hypothetical protein
MPRIPSLKKKYYCHCPLCESKIIASIESVTQHYKLEHNTSIRESYARQIMNSNPHAHYPENNETWVTCGAPGLGRRS